MPASDRRGINSSQQKGRYGVLFLWNDNSVAIALLNFTNQQVTNRLQINIMPSF